MSKKKETLLSSNSFSNTVAMIALLISVISAAYTIYKSEKSEQEVLSLVSKREHFQDNVRFYRGFPQLVLPSYWSCIITNNGNKTMSIIDYNIQAHKGGSNMMSYTHLDLGLFDDSMKPLILPINVEPGKSKRILVNVGVMIYPQADSILRQNLDAKSTYNFRDIQIILAKEGIDIFDNEVEAIIDNNELQMITWKAPELNKDVYSISFESGVGLKHHELLLWYPEL